MIAIGNEVGSLGTNTINIGNDDHTDTYLHGDTHINKDLNVTGTQ